MRDILERIAIALERIADAMEQHDDGERKGKNGAKLLITSPPPLRVDDLVAFLASRNIKLRDDARPAPSKDEGQDEMDGIAWLIGERWATVRLLVDAIKSRLGNGDEFILNLRGQGEAVISDICAVANRAHSLGLLERYRYRRSPAFRLEARPSRSPLSQRFWSGGWLERWARQHMLRIATQHHPVDAISWLANIPVTLPNGEGFEIDLLIRAGDKVMWAEVKSADYQEHMEKYSRVRRMLGLPPSNALVLLADPRAPYRALGALYELTVCGLDDFPACCAIALGKDDGEDEENDKS